MAASSSNEDLNSYFQSMSECAQEETDWNLNSKFLITKIKLLSKLTSQETSSNPVEFDVFGSSAEDLKFCLPNDIGDIDIMVYPVHEEAIIDDSVIEMVDGVSPVFVRLRGSNHPVLQHCMSGNSKFVSTSFLKEFHSNIFGEKTHFLSLIPRAFEKVKDFDVENIISSGVVDNPVGPSVQLDVKHSFGSITEQVKDQVNVFNTVTKNDGFRNLLEWLAISLNPKRTFTEEHSECIDDFLEVTQDKSQTFLANPSVTAYHDTLNQLLHGEHLSQLSQKVQEIDQKVQAAEQKTATRSVPSSKNTALSSPSLTNATCPDASSSNAAEATGLKDEATNSLDSTVDTTIKVTDIGDCEGSKTADLTHDNDNINETEGKQECTNSRRETSQVAPRNVVAGVDEAGGEQITVSDVQNLLTQQLLGGLFAKASPSTPTNESAVVKHYTSITPETLVDHQSSKAIQSGIDLVPALKGRGWPKVAMAWAKRARAWPSQDIVSKILESGFHVVVKSPPGYDDHVDQFFRLSFSRAELILSGDLNNIQRECYRCLKRYYRYVMEGRQVKVITSYFLKTVLLWAIEETGSTFWTDQNRAGCVLMLLERLHQYLESKFLPLYFIPEVNLLENAIINHFEEVDHMADQFRNILENPKIYAIVDEKGGHTRRRTSQKNAAILEEAATLDKKKAEASPSTTDSNSTPLRALEANANTQKVNSSHIPKDCEDENSSWSNVPRNIPKEADSTSFFLKYNDFQKIYKDIYKELIDMTLQQNVSHPKDPLIEPIISNLQNMASKMQNPEAELTKVLEHCSKDIYSTHVLHPGSTTRQRILSALKGYSDIFAFAVAQDDLLDEGNEHLIVARMLNSGGFNVSNTLMPNCFDFFKEIVQIVDAPASPSLKPCEDEIPLD